MIFSVASPGSGGSMVVVTRLPSLSRKVRVCVVPVTAAFSFAACQRAVRAPAHLGSCNRPRQPAAPRLRTPHTLSHSSLTSRAPAFNNPDRLNSYSCLPQPPCSSRSYRKPGRNLHISPHSSTSLNNAAPIFVCASWRTSQGPVCTYDGRKVINLASNNYLGLCNHPKLREAAVQAIHDHGVGSGAVRTIAGTMRIHMELEEKIARFKNVEACVVFQSGFTANAGTVGSILGKEDFILSDELNHASIIDGARLSKAKIKVFRHKDVAHCEELLQEVQNEPGKKLIITDGVFSMDGDIGPVGELAALAEKYGAIMMVDDAHASGVLGRNGRGSVDHFNAHGKVDVQVGTLSKAIGALGGYVCGSRDLIDFLYHRARPVPLLHLAPAFRRRHLHRRLRHPRVRARTHPAPLG